MDFTKEQLLNEAEIVANNLDAAAMASRANLNVIGRQTEIFRAAVGGVVNVDVVMPYAIRVLDVWCVKTGGAGAGGDSVRVWNGVAAISEALDTNDADTTISRAAVINRVNRDIAAGGTLRFAGLGAATNAAIVYVLAVRN